MNNYKYYYIILLSSILFLFNFNHALSGLYPVVDDDKVIYINQNGEIQITEDIDTPFEKIEIEIFGKKYPSYNFPEWAYFSEGKVTYLHIRKFLFIHLGNEYGVIDSTGKIIIEPNENVIWSFKNGLAKTEIPLRSLDYIYGNKYAFIDENGEYAFGQLRDSSKIQPTPLILISPIFYYLVDVKAYENQWYSAKAFDYCGNFSDGFAVTYLNNDSTGKNPSKFNYINAKGEIISDKGFDDIRTFSEGKGVVMVDSLWGVVNTKGEFIIQPKYNVLWGFSNGLARYFDGKNYGFINDKSEMQFQQLFISAGDFSDGYALVQLQFNEYNFIDTQGKILNYNFISDRQKNYQKGFSAAGNFSDNLAPVMIDGRWGYINTKGELAIPANFEFAQEFRGGFAPAWRGNEMYIINTEGKIIWTYLFE